MINFFLIVFNTNETAIPIINPEVNQVDHPELLFFVSFSIDMISDIADVATLSRSLRALDSSCLRLSFSDFSLKEPVSSTMHLLAIESHLPETFTESPDLRTDIVECPCREVNSAPSGSSWRFSIVRFRNVSDRGMPVMVSILRLRCSKISSFILYEFSAIALSTLSCTDLMLSDSSASCF